jgi:hypothetical protein
MRRILARLAVAFILFGVPAAVQARITMQAHCTASGMLFMSTTDSETGQVTVTLEGDCTSGPYTVIVFVFAPFDWERWGHPVGSPMRSGLSTSELTSRLNRYELESYRVLTTSTSRCRWLVPSQQFRAQIARYRVRGKLSLSLDQFSPGIARSLAEQMP